MDGLSFIHLFFIRFALKFLSVLLLNSQFFAVLGKNPTAVSIYGIFMLLREKDNPRYAYRP